VCLSQRNQLIGFVIEEGKTIKEAAHVGRININTAKTIAARYRNLGMMGADVRGGSETKLNTNTLNLIDYIVSDILYTRTIK
jgi:transposase